MTRYEAGETLASIARTYDCSPPAISYIVSRSRSRQPAAEAPASEPQLLKAHAGEAVSAVSEPAVAAVAASPAEAPLSPIPAFLRNGAGDRHGGTATMTRPMVPRPNAAPQPSSPLNGEHRRTLHLSLGGNGNGNGNGSNGHAPEPQAAGNGMRFPNGDRPSPAQAQPAPPPYPSERPESRQPPPPPRDQPRYGFPPNGGERSFGDSAARFDPDAGRRKETGNFIDQELRARVDGDIAAFLTAFDAALAGDTPESRSGLREATDRLLRAGARTRIELERLEARVPLSSRDGDGRAEPNWRHR